MMNKLTAEKCREQFEEWFAEYAGQTIEWVKGQRASDTLYKTGPEINGYWFAWQASREALEIALPVLEQQERGEQVDIISTPEHVLNEKWNAHFGLNQQPTANLEANEGEWIEWGGGKQPIPSSTPVEVRFRNGATNREDLAGGWSWECTPDDPRYWDIIAYRVVEQERERGEEE